MIQDIFKGIASYFKAIPFLFKRGVFRYLVLTGVISFIIGTSIFAGIWSFSEPIGQWLSSFYTFEKGSEIVSFISVWILRISLFLLTIIVYRYIILIVTAPIMSVISEKVEYLVTGKEIPKQGIMQNLNLVSRGIRLSLRNVFKELLYTVLLLGLGLFTGIGFLLSPIILLIQAYYAGFGNLDFYLERKFNFNESLNFIGSNKGLAIGNGLVYMFILMIPVLGFIIGPALSTIAATLEGIRKSEGF